MLAPDALLIFIKNPELGKVKTRLALDIGKEQALLVYQQLLHHTLGVTINCPANKLLFYSSFIDENDMWPDSSYQKLLQLPANDLGERMLQAFEVAFAQGYQKVVIIGSDCPELSTSLLHDAFEVLNTNDFVVGPSKDGGYYLLGMKKLEKRLFMDKEWSTNGVIQSTLEDINLLNMTYGQLPMLNDIDNYEDLMEFEHLSPKF